MPDLIVFYDADDWLMRTTGPQRSGVDLSVGIKDGLRGLRRVLDAFVAKKIAFQRAIFHCHGNEGLIVFGDEKGNRVLDAQELRTNFTGRGYERIFPNTSRIYFNGCKVSGGEHGWQFLETAGSIFLRSLGGEAFAHTANGYPLVPHAVMLLGGVTGLLIGGSMLGHMPHFSGESRSVLIGPGGRALRRVTKAD